MIAPALGDALTRFLQRKQSLDGASANTIAAYATDLRGFLGFMAQHLGGLDSPRALGGITQSDMRAWMADAARTGLVGTRLGEETVCRARLCAVHRG